LVVPSDDIWNPAITARARSSPVAPHMSAFGGKADMGKLYSTLGKSGHRALLRAC